MPAGRLTAGWVFSILLAFATFTNSSDAANWYVDKDASGSRNGTNWVNAWTSFSQVVWGSSGVKAGDTLNISGGSGSKTYTEEWTIGADGTSDTNRITIRTGQDAGHNGTVIFDRNAEGDYGTGKIINADGRDYITISGKVGSSIRMEFRNFRNIESRGDATAISSAGNKGLLAEYIRVTNCNNGVDIYSGSDSSVRAEVRYSDFVGIRGDRAIRMQQGKSNSWDKHAIHHCTIQTYRGGAKPSGWTGAAYNGPDGIQAGHNVSVFDCTLRVLPAPSGIITSTQHSDLIQSAFGWYQKIYNNEFINVGDAQLKFEWANNGESTSNVWIYNNVFRIEEPIDLTPEYIRWIDPHGYTPTSIDQVKIMNNTFIDNDNACAITIRAYPNSPSGSGNEIKNNIFYRVGKSSASNLTTTIYIENSTNMTWGFDHNVYYNPQGTMYIFFDEQSRTPTQHISAFEPHGAVARPAFSRYDGYQDADTNVSLATSDSVATRSGANLSSYFLTDHAGNPRPQGSAWSVGAFEGAVATLAPAIEVAPAVADAGTVEAGQSKDVQFTVTNTGSGTLSGSASVSAPFSIVSGGAYSLGTGQSTVVTVRYSPVTPSTDNHTVTFTGASGATATVKGTSTTTTLGTSFESTSGSISAPFVANLAGFISQSTSADTPETGGRAAYTFAVPQSGTYTVSAQVDAPTTGTNSLFANIDAEPSNPTMIWDINPVTNGFEDRTVCWRGTGTPESAEINPKVFTLSAGTHTLIIRGREADTRLGRITIVPYVSGGDTGVPPSAPSNLVITQ